MTYPSEVAQADGETWTDIADDLQSTGRKLPLGSTFREALMELAERARANADEAPDAE